MAKIKRRFLSILLSLAMMLGMMSGMRMTVYADDPYASIIYTKTLVSFDGEFWYLVEKDNSTVTLLLEDCVAASKFGSNGTYSGSTVEGVVNNWYTGNISTDAKEAVNGNKAFLLTYSQASTLNSLCIDVLKCSQFSGAEGNEWWLCTTGKGGSSYAACVFGSSGTVYEYGEKVSKVYAVRPAIKLNLNKVSFDSASKTFTPGGKAMPEANDFTFTAPTNLVYDGTAKSATVGVKSGVTGMGNITVKYFSDSACQTQVQANNVKNADTYYVAIDVAEGEDYSAATLKDTSWAFEIQKASPAATDFTFTPPQNLDHDGNAKSASVTPKSSVSGMGTVTVKHYSDSARATEVAKEDVKDPGKYYVGITVDTGINYSSSTSVISDSSWSFTIKEDPIAAVPTGLKAIYGQTLADVTLSNPEGNTPGTWTWKDATTTKVGNAGVNTFQAKFTPDDTVNYTTLNNIDVTITVSKADPTATVPTATATYGQTLTDVALTNPEGNTAGTWTWVDDTTDVGNVGTATFQANFTPNDTENYNSVSGVDVTVTVGKADPIATAPTATATYGQTLADVALTNPAGNTTGTWAWVDAGTTGVGNVGDNTFKANFTPNDTANYNGKTNVDVTIAVSKADPTVAAPTGLTAIYGQTLAEVTLTNPEGNIPGTWAWTNGTAKVGNAGTNTFTAIFTPDDTANYNTVSDVNITVTVSKADPVAFAPSGEAYYGKTLANVALTNPNGNTPGTWTWVDAGTTSVGYKYL